MSDLHLLESLAAEPRLALSYAPKQVKPLFLVLFALDARLAAVVHSAREPMLAQLKLAWWREQLEKPASARAKGQPVLAVLDPWQGEIGGLAALVDGWEHLLPSDSLAAEDFAAFAKARGEACAALARLVEADPEPARCAGMRWAYGDLARFASHSEQPAEIAAAATQDKRPALDRSMRPLLVLDGLARRRIAAPSRDQGIVDFLVAIRLGMLGI